MYRYYYDLRLSRGSARMLYSIDNRLGVLCTVYHGNIRTYGSLLNMDSAGLVQGIVRTRIMKNLAGTLESPLVVKV